MSASASRVLLDSSPFFRFAESGGKALAGLANYLGAKASITAEVDYELRRNSRKVRALQNLERMGWPTPPPLDLPPVRRQELLDIKKAREGGHAKEDLGEISTVLMAQELGDAIVVIDDRFGKQLSAFRKVARLSTAQLVAEMVAAGSMGEDLALEIYRHATPAGVGRNEFRADVSKSIHASK